MASAASSVSRRRPDQVEALGSRLFDRIDGDYFAVLGLSLYPVLGYLRREGFLAF